MNKPLEALQQSFLRTKSTNFAGFEETMQLNQLIEQYRISNKSGNIAYWQGNLYQNVSSQVVHVACLMAAIPTMTGRENTNLQKSYNTKTLHPVSFRTAIQVHIGQQANTCKAVNTLIT